MDGCAGSWLLHGPNHGFGLDYSADAISPHASYVSSGCFLWGVGRTFRPSIPFGHFDGFDDCDVFLVSRPCLY